MGKLLFIPITALVLVLFESSASAQHGHGNIGTPSSSIQHGYHSQSAIHVGRQQHRTYPSVVINTLPKQGSRHGGRNFFYGNRYAYRHVHSSYCHYTAEHYTTQYRQIHVPAHYEQQYVPPRYEYRFHHGRQQKVLVENGYNTQVYVKAHYESQPYQVYVPASWSCGYSY